MSMIKFLSRLKNAKRTVYCHVTEANQVETGKFIGEFEIFLKVNKTKILVGEVEF